MLDAEQLGEVTRSVWSSILGDEPQALTMAPTEGTAFVSGCVWVAGGWDGAVMVDCTPHLARRATAAMFDVSADQATHDEIVDAVGEIANMIGGNVKALLPGPSTLSLPIVSDSSATFSRSAILHEEHFMLDGDAIRVRVVVQAPDAGSGKVGDSK